jgi:cell shape-determining protein MreC
MTEERFWNATPREIKPYMEAERIRLKTADRNNFYAGAYIYHAVAAAVENVFNGPKAKAKYLKQPFSEMQSEEEMSEERKRELTQQLFSQLEVMQMNFELSKKSMSK